MGRYGSTKPPLLSLMFGCLDRCAATCEGRVLKPMGPMPEMVGRCIVVGDRWRATSNTIPAT